MKQFDEFEPRKSSTLPIKEVIDALFEKHKLDQKISETKLIESWNSVMGPSIGRRTKELYIKDKKLFIKLSSAPLRNELKMNRSKVIGLLNAAAGKQVITDLVML